MDFQELFSRLSKKQLTPIYLLTGEETYLLDEAVSKIKELALEGALPDFNLNVFYASDCKPVDVKDAVETLPMMATRRLVVLKQCQDLSASELDEMIPLVENPVDSTVLVFVGEKADMRKKLFKLCEKNGVAVKFPRLYPNQTGPWISSIAKKYGKTINLESIELLKEWVGCSLVEINQEMAKLSQYVGLREELTVEDIKAVVSRTRQETVFQFANALGVGDRAASFTYLANLLGYGESEVGVLAMAIRHFRILLLCQEAQREGLSSTQIASRVGVHHFFIRDYLEQAKRQSSQHLLRVYDTLLETDRALKSNPLSSHIWLENLVLQACNPVSP